MDPETEVKIQTEAQQCWKTDRMELQGQPTGGKTHNNEMSMKVEMAPLELLWLKLGWLSWMVGLGGSIVLKSQAMKSTYIDLKIVLAMARARKRGSQVTKLSISTLARGKPRDTAVTC